MAVDKRDRLSIEDAYELVRRYVKYFWSTYRATLGREMDKEDVVQDVMVKLTREKPNPDYDPDWEPGKPYKVKTTRAADGPRKEIDTSYMLKDNYSPEDPYDSNYFLPKKQEFNYLDKYNGRTTSKSYYIMSIVKNNLADKADKRDLSRYSASLDKEIGDGDDGRTLGDMVADPSTGDDKVYHELAAKDLKQLLMDCISEMDITPLSPRIVGWSPVTGQKDKDGNKIETHLTARDIGIFMLYGYEPSDIEGMYHDTKTGQPVSISTIKKKWAEAADTVRRTILNNEKLRNSGYLDAVLKRES